MKIAVFSTKPYDEDFFTRYGEAYEELAFSFFETSLNKHTANLAAGFDAVCIFVNDTADEETLNRLQTHGVALIALRCAGYNNVDLAAAKATGIAVVRVPAYAPESVAEHALALILTLNRKTHKAYNRVREGNFALRNLMGFNLHGKTVGVVGTGKIGTTFARLMQGFGCEVLAFDVQENEELTQAGVQYLPLEELFGRAEIISLHCPLNEHTHHLIDQQAIQQMKKGVMLINTSRGGLINTPDVVQGLIERKIGYLGIDVYEQEENLFFEDLSERIIQDDVLLRLLGFPNVLITSHQAFFTHEAMEEITTTTLENLRAFVRKEALVNAVT